MRAVASKVLSGERQKTQTTSAAGTAAMSASLYGFQLSASATASGFKSRRHFRCPNGQTG